VQERLFEPFFTTKAEGKGTGLGLTTVFSVVAQFNGAIEVSSEPGQGALFTIRFPLLQQAAAGLSDDKNRSEIDLAGLCVVVDDQPGVLDVTARMLSREGFRTQTYASPKEFLQQTGSADPPQLLIVDIFMDEMDGVTLAQQALKLYPSLKVLFHYCPG